MDYVKSQYDISDWEFDFTFLTEEEIKYAQTYLANYMWSTFKCYDKEVIHKTILRAFHGAHSFDPNKSNKWTWMATICRNVYLSRSASSNKIRQTLSLDDKVPGTGKDRSFAEYVVDDVSEADDDMLMITKEIKWIVENGKYPYIRMRLDGLSYIDISNKMGVDKNTVRNRLHKERGILKKHLMEYGNDEMRSHLKSRKRNGKKEEN